MLSGFAATASAAMLLSFAIVGWHAALQYPAYTLHWASTPLFGRMPPSLMPNLLGLVTGWPIAQGARWPLQLGVLAVSALLLIVVARMRNRANDRNLLALAFACAVITAVLVGYNTGSYDLSLLVLPIALLADYCLGGFEGLPGATTRLVLPAVPLLLSPLWFLLWRRWERMNLMAIFLLWWLYAIRRETLALVLQELTLRRELRDLEDVSVRVFHAEKKVSDATAIDGPDFYAVSQKIFARRFDVVRLETEVIEVVSVGTDF